MGGLKILLTLTLLLCSGCGQFFSDRAPAVEIMNVSYDPTREFYRDYNAWFTENYCEGSGESVRVLQSHGSSGKQARFVIDGLEAHVVTLALAYDIDAISSKTGKLPPDWQTRLPHGSAPYTSTIVFLVRSGNPKNIQDWGDLIKVGVEVITPNPLTSGGARWNYLAAWGYALLQALDEDQLSRLSEDDPLLQEAEEKAFAFLSALFRNVPVLDSGARGATTTFARRGIGDVLITWENEALLALKSLPQERLEIVTPSVSILTEPTVSLVDEVIDKRHTRDVAQAYLEGLYSPEGQALAARHYFRPREMQHASPEDRDKFPELHLFTLEEFFGDWQKAHEKHFSPAGCFNRLYAMRYANQEK
ncbi:MAG: sulfate ABC transporter substrate-binding protein [Candidatus Hydrogenedens sp.]|nr:sulfate ABC transporter substrate-binding protein [Candidatus Hydrogenedens sp.]